MKREEILKAAEKCVNWDRDKLFSRNPEVKNFRCKPEIFHKK